MTKWGSCDFKELERLQKRLEKMENQRAEFCETCAKELAARLLSLAVKRTPVGKAPRLELPKGDKSVRVNVRGTDGKLRKRSFLSPEAARVQQIKLHWKGYTGGTLRKAWTAGEIRRQGSDYTVDVINDTFYASYVEYGHRQQPGRYVPALGKRLKKAWVPGKKMMTISAKEVERMAPKMLEKRLKEFLEECLNAE